MSVFQRWKRRLLLKFEIFISVRDYQLYFIKLMMIIIIIHYSYYLKDCTFS